MGEACRGEDGRSVIGDRVSRTSNLPQNSPKGCLHFPQAFHMMQSVNNRKVESSSRVTEWIYISFCCERRCVIICQLMTPDPSCRSPADERTELPSQAGSATVRTSCLAAPLGRLQTSGVHRGTCLGKHVQLTLSA